MVNIRAQLRFLWTASPALTLLFLLMLATFAANLLGLALDPRLITGAPAWLKPAKFAISTAIFAATVAWMLPYLTFAPRQRALAANIISAALFIEIFIINLQAARGTTSHFNVRTPLDGALFFTMGVSIAVLWLATFWLCVLLFLQPFASRPLAWALRLGLLITVMGAGTGGLMTLPTPPQQVVLATRPSPTIGAHTVGAPDGGPGLPVTQWSTRHGDLRIPHFLGLHGAQIVPLFYLVRTRRRKTISVPQVVVFAASYAAFATLLGWQALRGQSLAQPDAATLTALALWLTATLAAWTAVTRRAFTLPLAASSRFI